VETLGQMWRTPGHLPAARGSHLLGALPLAVGVSGGWGTANGQLKTDGRSLLRTDAGGMA